MIIGFFTVYPVFGNGDPVHLANIYEVIKHYSIFSVALGLLVTLLNDLKNTDLDYNEGLNTLPIAIGKERAAKITFGVGIIVAGLILYYINAYLKELLWAMAYLLVFVLGPVIYCLINLWSAKTSKDFAVLEIVIKAVIFFTSLSIAVITFNINSNA